MAEPATPAVEAVELGSFSIRNPKPKGAVGGGEGDAGPDDGNAAKGAKLFKAKCASCHTIKEGGPNMQGPNLFGIMGQQAGKVSRALRCVAGCLLHAAPLHWSTASCADPALRRALWQRAGQKYTKPMKQSGIIWDNQIMFDWLISPKTVVKGTNMAFPGFKKAADSADVVAFLNQNK